MDKATLQMLGHTSKIWSSRREFFHRAIKVDFPGPACKCFTLMFQSLEPDVTLIYMLFR